MKVKLSKAAVQLREQIDDSFPDRDRASDGWIGDSRHAHRVSDHNPDAQGWVRAACKSKSEKRISYIIFDGQIASPILGWRWRKYTGANKHTKHCHVSFKKTADLDGAFYQVSMLGGE